MREADTFDIGLKGVKQNYIDKLSPDVLWGKGLENQRIKNAEVNLLKISREGNRKRTRKGGASNLPNPE